MCLLCGSGAASGASFMALTERPAHKLHGLAWSGTHEEASAGAIRRLIERVKAHSDGRTSPWKSPIVGISWDDRPDGFRHFVGVAPDPGEVLPEGFEALELEQTDLASSWHGPADGEVVEHYGRMIAWAAEHGYNWDTDRFHHREEYPHDIDLAAPLRLRLLIPIRPST